MTRPWALWALIPSLTVSLALATPAMAAPAPAAAPAAGASAGASAGAGASGGRALPAFPVSVTSQGRTVRIQKKPMRILCVSASATQMLYAIGAGSQVVAVDKYSTYPAQAPRTGLTGAETSAEEYARYHPDLVIVAYDEGTMVQQLTDLHIPALVLGPATGIPDVYAQIAELGRATGHSPGAAAVEASLKRFLAHQVSYAGDQGWGASYYIELSPQPLYTATSATFVGSEFSLFGMRDIADKAGHGNAYPEVSSEYVLAANPQWVFLADTVCCHVTPSNFARRPGFDLLSAVADHHVLGVDDSVASQWGPHTIEEFTNFLARELHG